MSASRGWRGRGRAGTGARRQADAAEAKTDDTRSGTATEERATLIPPDRAESYGSRWTQRKAISSTAEQGRTRGEQLVGEVLDELEELFRRQRAELEQGLDSEQTTTEDLRQALGHIAPSSIACSPSKHSQLRRVGRLPGWRSPRPGSVSADRLGPTLYRTGRLSGRWTSMLDAWT